MKRGAIKTLAGRLKPMVFYNAANIFSGGASYIISIYFLSFLTEVEGLSAAQAGMVVMIAKIWDAVSDPAMGIITDRTRSRYGRHRRYLLFGALPVFVSFFMMWNSFGISALNNATATMAYYIFAYVCYSTAYTLVVVPHTAMLPELVPDYAQRTNYNSVGYLMNSVGQVSSFLLVSVTLGFTNMEAIGPHSRTTFQVLGLILAVWFALPLVFTFRKTREPSSLGMHVEPVDFHYLWTEYRLVFKNRAFRQYFVMSLFYTMCLGFYANTDQYFIKYAVNRFSLFNMLTTVSGVAEASGFPVNYVLTMKKGKQFCGKLLGPVLLIGLAFGLFMNSATPTAVIYLACILYNFGFSGIGFTATNIFPDVTDVDEMITGRRREGVIATFSTFIKKAVSGFMAAFVGLILEGFGFVPGQEAAQSDGALFGLRFTFAILPLLFALLSMISVYRYRMTKADHQMIRRAIAQKKETGHAELSPEQQKLCEEISGVPYEEMWLGRPEMPTETKREGKNLV